MSFNNRQLSVGAILLMIILALLSVACGRPTDQRHGASEPSPTSGTSQFPRWPTELSEFRFHWSASPGIELASGPSVALRAYLESFRLVGLTGGDTSAAYAGFDRATPENVPAELGGDTLYQLTGVRPRSRAEAQRNGWKYVGRKYYGYQPIHILELQPTDNAFRALICVGNYSTYRTEDDDHSKFFSMVANPQTGNLTYGDWELVDTWRIELSENDPSKQQSGVSPSIPQVGPLPAPTDDVFGRWFVSGATTGLWGPSGHAEKVDTPEIRQQCEDAMPDDAAARKAMGTGFHDAPPPHGDPMPGWPQASG